MQVLASHQANRAVPAGADKAYAADLYRPRQPGDVEALHPTAKIVALNVFKSGAPASDQDLPASLNDDDGMPMDLAMSLLEEVQQARFREARRLKRVETLEHDIRVARAQNEALRTALQSARCDAEDSGPDSKRARKTFDVARPRKLSRSLLRLFRNGH